MILTLKVSVSQCKSAKLGDKLATKNRLSSNNQNAVNGMVDAFNRLTIV